MMNSSIYCILGRRLEIQPDLRGKLALCILLTHLDLLIHGHPKAESSCGLSATMWLDVICKTLQEISKVMFSEVAH